MDATDSTSMASDSSSIAPRLLRLGPNTAVCAHAVDSSANGSPAKAASGFAAGAGG